jgi:2-oxoisovalerate dehydrogenase E1 component alpha subunit
MIRREFTAIARRATVFTKSFCRSAIHKLENLPTTNSPIVSELSFFNSVTGNDTQIPTFRVLDGVGKPLEGAVLPDVGVVLSIQFYFFISTNRLRSLLLGACTKI